MQKVQSLENKVGEIKFRKKLSLHLQKSNPQLPNQPTKKEYIQILKDRVNDSRLLFKQLQQKAIPLSPFLEIGAERGQRSMLLVNEFNATGFMSDISYDSLASGIELKKSLGFKSLQF